MWRSPSCPWSTSFASRIRRWSSIYFIPCRSWILQQPAPKRVLANTSTSRVLILKAPSLVFNTPLSIEPSMNLKLPKYIMRKGTTSPAGGEQKLFLASGGRSCGSVRASFELTRCSPRIESEHILFFSFSIAYTNGSRGRPGNQPAHSCSYFDGIVAYFASTIVFNEDFAFLIVLSFPLLQLKPVYEEFVCPICFSMIEECMTTTCGHSFCSECIKECLNRKHQCPCCNHPTTVKELFRNLHADRLVGMF